MPEANCICEPGVYNDDCPACAGKIKTLRFLRELLAIRRVERQTLSEWCDNRQEDSRRYDPEPWVYKQETLDRFDREHIAPLAAHIQEIDHEN